MATATQTEYGWYISASGGTGTVTVLGASILGSIKVCGIACGGSATNDIVTVYSGMSQTTAASTGGSTQGVPVYSNVGGNPGALSALNLSATIRLFAPTVTFVGGTSGVCYIYTPSGNY